MRAVFLDKDGTLLEDVPYNVDPSKMRLMEGVAEGLFLLHSSGYKLIVVSNQSGVARGRFPEYALAGVKKRMHRLFGECNVPLAGFYYCPHHPEGTQPGYNVECDCRKPAPGLILRAARDHGIDLEQSWFIGDILNDVEAGRSAGCRTILLNNGNETEWVLTPQRMPDHVASDMVEAALIIVALTWMKPRLRGGSSLYLPE